MTIDELRQALARTLWASEEGSRVSWEETNDWWRDKYLRQVDALLAGPLVPLLAELRAVEQLDSGRRDELHLRDSGGLMEPTLTQFLLARFAEDEMRASTIDCPCGETSTHPLPHCGARVLADCEAKRQLIAETQKFYKEIKYDAFGAEPTYKHLILSHLALPFIDHPDYREEWKA